MRRTATFLLGLAVLAVVATASTGAAATPVQMQDQTNTTTADEPRGERIDESLTLVSSSYDDEAGTATIVLHASDHVAVTLADSGGFIDGGEITRRTFALEPGTTEVQMPVTETDGGLVGVSIATEDVLYAEVIEQQRMLLPGLRSQYSGTMLVGATVLSAMVGVGVMVVLLVVVGKQLKKRRPL